MQTKNTEIEQTHNRSLGIAPIFSSKTHAKVSNLDECPILSTEIAQNVEMQKMTPSKVLIKRLPFLAIALIVAYMLVHFNPGLDLKAFGIQLIASILGAYTLLEARFSLASLISCLVAFASFGLYLALTAPFYSFQIWTGALSITAFTVIFKFFLSQEYKNTYFLPSRNYYVWFPKIELNPAIFYVLATFTYIAIAFVKQAQGW